MESPLHWLKEEHISMLSTRPHDSCCNAEKVSMQVYKVALSPNLSELYNYYTNKVSIGCRIINHEDWCIQSTQ